MTQQAIHLRKLARGLVSAMPSRIAESMRNAKRAVLNRREPRAVFAKIAEGNSWDGTESVSGPGSTMEATRLLRAVLPELLSQYKIGSLLDIPCGDAYWISQSLPEGIAYIGGDIVPSLVKKASIEKGSLGRFEVLDLANDVLPQADLVMVRDCFIHLPNTMVLKAIANVKRSGARYLLTTTYPGRAENIDIELGGFRPIDLEKSPFNLAVPLEVILETEGLTSGKSIALWRTESL